MVFLVWRVGFCVYYMFNFSDFDFEFVLFYCYFDNFYIVVVVSFFCILDVSLDRF